MLLHFLQNRKMNGIVRIFMRSCLPNMQSVEQKVLQTCNIPGFRKFRQGSVRWKTVEKAVEIVHK